MKSRIQVFERSTKNISGTGIIQEGANEAEPKRSNNEASERQQSSKEDASEAAPKAAKKEATKEQQTPTEFASEAAS